MSAASHLEVKANGDDQVPDLAAALVDAAYGMCCSDRSYFVGLLLKLRYDCNGSRRGCSAQRLQMG